MKIKISREDLLKSMGYLLGAVEKRNTMAILSFLLVKAEGNSLALTATDLDICIKDAIPADVQKPGTVTVSAQMLNDIARKLPQDALIDIEVVGNNRLSITSGRSSFKLGYLAPEEFPTLDLKALPHHFSLKSEDLRRLIDHTRFAISTEETRYYLNGIYLHIITDEGTPLLRAVATDGHRLAKVDLPAPAGSENCPGVIVPKKALDCLRKLIDSGDQDIAIELSETTIRFRIGDVLLSSKLIDGTYPDYAHVIPKNNPRTMEVNRLAFAQAIDRIAVMSQEKTRAIKLNFTPNNVTLSSASPEAGSAVEELDIVYNADPLEIGFNVRYLLDVAHQAEGETFRLALNEPSSPAVVEGSVDQRALYVLMPMRV